MSDATAFKPLISILDTCQDQNQLRTYRLNRKRLRHSSSNSHRATNVVYQENHVSREKRGQIIGKHVGFRGCTIWLTGLSGAGKTTVAFALEDLLTCVGVPAYGLDGDNMRHGINSNLGFSHADREENIRRVAEVAKLFADLGVVCLASFISPFEKDRQNARRIHEEAGLTFVEVFVDTPLEICELRDNKGLYQKARAGKIKSFTGIDSVYEIPETPDVHLAAGQLSVAECVNLVVDKLLEKNILTEAMLQHVSDHVPELVFPDAQRSAAVEVAKNLPRLDICDIDLQWVQVLAEGWATPLAGFMKEEQYLQCLHFGRLHGEGGVNQSIPIVLPVSDEDKRRLASCTELCLWHNERPVALLNDLDFFAHRKEERCSRTFGTTNLGHPGVKVFIVSTVVFNWLIVIVELLINLRIFEMGQPPKDNTVSKALHLINVSLLGFFVLEMWFKILVMGGRFFKHRMEMFDLIVVSLAFSLTLAFGGRENSTDSIGLLIVLRLWRVSKIISSMIEAVKHEAERKMAKERRFLRALEREVGKLREYCTQQECELQAYRTLLRHNAIPLPSALRPHQPPPTPRTLNVIAEVNEVEQTATRAAAPPPDQSLQAESEDAYCDVSGAESRPETRCREAEFVHKSKSLPPAKQNNIDNKANPTPVDVVLRGNEARTIVVGRRSGKSAAKGATEDDESSSV